jgi:hypothetical protein
MCSFVHSEGGVGAQLTTTAEEVVRRLLAKRGMAAIGVDLHKDSPTLVEVPG